MAEIFLFIAVLALPIVAGGVAVYLGRPWWWGAIVAVAVVLVAAIAPEPEEGESRVAAGDIVFLLAIAAIAIGLAWIGGKLARRLVRTA